LVDGKIFQGQLEKKIPEKARKKLRQTQRFLSIGPSSSDGKQGIAKKRKDEKRPENR
jgi:hypothetical protein